MKKIALLIILAIASLGAEGKPGKPGMMIIRHHDMIYFRVKKKMLGSNIKVYDDQNKLIAKQLIYSKRNIIDFFEAPPGNYVIKIVARDGERELKFSKGKRISKLTISPGEVLVSAASVGI